MTTTAWPFDADRDDPLTKLRIPVVGSFNPEWRYVAAYLKPADGDFQGPPFGSMERPTDAEARMIASFIEEYLHYFFRESYQRKLAQRPLDVDGGCNTTVFIKYGPDDWGYRRCSWIYGPTFVPGPAGSPSREAAGTLSLVQVMDHTHTIVDQPIQHWADWKVSHPEVFGQVSP